MSSGSYVNQKLNLRRSSRLRKKKNDAISEDNFDIQQQKSINLRNSRKRKRRKLKVHNDISQTRPFKIRKTKSFQIQCMFSIYRNIYIYIYIIIYIYK